MLTPEIWLRSMKNHAQGVYRSFFGILLKLLLPGLLSVVVVNSAIDSNDSLIASKILRTHTRKLMSKHSWHSMAFSRAEPTLQASRLSLTKQYR